MEKKNALLIKHFEKDLNLLKAIVPNAKETKHFGRKRALVCFANREETSAAFTHLVAAFKGTKTQVQFQQTIESQSNYKKRKKLEKVYKISRGTQTDFKWKDVGSLPEEFIRKLYGIDDDIRFDRPPPPFLHYDYPKATMDIVDAISIELMKNVAFYTQVLHIMNRMNLDPPFPAKDVYFRRGVPKNVATQTGEKDQEEQSHSSSSESELGDDDNCSISSQSFKRKKGPTEEQMKKKARLVLKAALHTTLLSKENKKQKNHKINTVFETIPSKSRKIEINLPVKNKMPKQIENPIEETLQIPFLPPTDLSSLKISEEEHKVLPIFQNYVKGEASDKLYIKNLAKNVTREDLISLYERFVINAHEDLDVRVMQQGRMKGQAFVTFQSKTVDNKLTANIALEATNGLKVREKPLVVSFGKKRETS